MRDPALEALVADDLAGLDTLRTTVLFAGLAWMWRGNLLCAASTEGLLARLGKGNEGWTTARAEITAMVMGGRPMAGWVRLAPAATGDRALRHRLLDAARGFVGSLPAK